MTQQDHVKAHEALIAEITEALLAADPHDRKLIVGIYRSYDKAPLEEALARLASSTDPAAQAWIKGVLEPPLPEPERDCTCPHCGVKHQRPY